MSTPDLLVTGAGGKLGQRVLHHLLTTLEVPAHRIAAASRKPDSLTDWAARGITVRKADFDDAASLDLAFAGISRLLLISTDSLDKPGHRLAQHRAAIEAAARAGVGHVVYTSLPNAEKSAILFAPDHAGTEAALGGIGVERSEQARQSLGQAVGHHILHQAFNRHRNHHERPAARLGDQSGDFAGAVAALAR